MPWGVMHSQSPSSTFVRARPGMPKVAFVARRARVGNFSTDFAKEFSYRNPVLVVSFDVSITDLLCQE